MFSLPTSPPILEGDFTPEIGAQLLDTYVRALLDVPGDHLVWIGPVDRQGGGVRLGQAGPLIDPFVALARCYLPPLTRGKEYKSSCGYPGCCNLQHVEISAVQLGEMALRPVPQPVWIKAKKASVSEWRDRHG